MNKANRFSNCPDRIRGLERPAYNLWLSWNPPARDLFRALDGQAWRESRQNPIRMVSLPREGFDLALQDSEFLRRYNAVIDQFDAETATQAGWFSAEYGRVLSSPLVYLSAEYGLHASLPIYAGGLGILAGDHLKECSDLAVPVVAVELFYDTVGHSYVK
jgi:starch phosphorylase